MPLKKLNKTWTKQKRKETLRKQISLTYQPVRKNVIVSPDVNP